jgi:hypothetical protein
MIKFVNLVVGMIFSFLVTWTVLSGMSSIIYNKPFVQCMVSGWSCE